MFVSRRKSQELGSYLRKESAEKYVSRRKIADKRIADVRCQVGSYLRKESAEISEKNMFLAEKSQIKGS